MSIQMDVVRICGFRGISNLEIFFPRVTVLLGQNNAGKTSVIKALQLALGDYARHLSDEDFHIGKGDKRYEKITVDLRFIALNADGVRTDHFSEAWQREFGDKIQAEADGRQFVAIRTTAISDRVKGGYLIERFHLESWPPQDNWEKFRTSLNNKLRGRLESIPFISIDAQRDIHGELKDKSSFIGRVLSSVEYNDKDVSELELMVAEINKEAIEKSEPLKRLKVHLDSLNKSFNGAGQAELTPFPKKIRDLSKRFSVHYGESDKSSFSMEYHGMGTRSWASMLTVKAFTELLAKNHAKEMEPFFPIMAAEEPEAHLHPNAQRTLYKQLIDTPGQAIISTHSPYIAGLAGLDEIKSLKKVGDAVNVFQVRGSSEKPDDLRKLKREVVHSRGELLFSTAIVLSEGETEEQALPELFEAYTGSSPFSLGINFVGINGSGAKYRPFLILAKDLNIPLFIFSDGEARITKELKQNYELIFGPTDIENAENITILEGTDFEGYLLNEGFKDLIEEAIRAVNGPNIDEWIAERDGTPLKPTKTNKPNCKYCKQPIFESELRNFSGEDGRKKAILEIMDSSKPLYAKAVTENLIKLSKDKYPAMVVKLFKQIQLGI